MDSKISALPLLEDATGDDLVVIVDTSEGVTKHISIAELFTQIGADFGTIKLQGDWDASSGNEPTSDENPIPNGYAWRVSVEGNTNLGGITVWHVGDLALKTSTGWLKIASSDVSAVWNNISGDPTTNSELMALFNNKADLENGKIIDSQIPESIKNIVVVNSFNNLPPVGIETTVYITTDTNKLYRWESSGYINITSGAIDSVNSQTGIVNLNQDDITDGETFKQFSETEKTKLSTIENGAEVNNISDSDAAILTGGEINNADTLHTHNSKANKIILPTNGAGLFALLHSDSVGNYEKSMVYYANTMTDLKNIIEQSEYLYITIIVNPSTALLILSGNINIKAKRVTIYSAGSSIHLANNLTFIDTYGGTSPHIFFDCNVTVESNANIYYTDNGGGYFFHIFIKYLIPTNTVTFTKTSGNFGVHLSSYDETKTINSNGASLYLNDKILWNTNSHNDFIKKQGGTINEYYHLTQNQHNILTNGLNADSLHTHDNFANVQNVLLKSNNLNDVDNQQNALNNIVNISQASNEQVLTKDTATGNAIWKDTVNLEQLNNKADLIDGKVPASQLPSFVDDIEEYASLGDLPTTGESGKIYLVTDTNKTYRWSGSGYVEISSSLALGETDSTAYRGDRGKIGYDHSQEIGTNPHDTTLEAVRTENNTISGDINANNNTITNLKTPVNNGDATSKIWVDSKQINTQNSIEGGGNLSTNRTIQLVNDELNPGVNSIYAVGGTGIKGWYNFPHIITQQFNLLNGNTIQNYSDYLYFENSYRSGNNNGLNSNNVIPFMVPQNCQITGFQAYFGYIGVSGVYVPDTNITINIEVLKIMQNSVQSILAIPITHKPQTANNDTIGSNGNFGATAAEYNVKGGTQTTPLNNGDLIGIRFNNAPANSPTVVSCIKYVTFQLLLRPVIGNYI